MRAASSSRSTKSNPVQSSPIQPPHILDESHLHLISAQVNYSQVPPARLLAAQPSLFVATYPWMTRTTCTRARGNCSRYMYVCLFAPSPLLLATTTRLVVGERIRRVYIHTYLHINACMQVQK
jgi:hypothetical protein